jgi:hypothetical protein
VLLRNVMLTTLTVSGEVKVDASLVKGPVTSTGGTIFIGNSRHRKTR